MTEEIKITVIIVDDIAETRENIRKLLQFDPRIEVVGVAKTGEEGIKVAAATKPDVVLMDINMPDMDGITATERIRAKLPGTQIVILSVQSDPNYMRRAMLAGARDFLTKPPDVDELTSAIQRAGEMAQQEKIKEATTLAAVQAVGTAGVSQIILPGAFSGKIITVYGPKGGTGATTITANLAVALHSDETPVLVVDGRLQFGDLSFFFNEQTKTNIANLTARADELDPEFVDEVLINHETTGIKILAAPPRLEQAESVHGKEFVDVIQYLKRMFAYVIVDTGSSLDEVTLATIDASDLVTLVTTQDIPSIKNIRLFLDLMDALGYPRQQVVLVMNRFDKRRNVNADRVADIAKSEVVAVLPVEEKLVIPAMDRGTPFLIQTKNHPVSKAIFDLAKAIRERIAELEEIEAEAI
jgi:pilus assembly protein CpaE